MFLDFEDKYANSRGAEYNAKGHPQESAPKNKADGPSESGATQNFDFAQNHKYAHLTERPEPVELQPPANKTLQGSDSTFC